MSAAKNFVQILEKFVNNPQLKGSYAESIWRGFHLLDTHNQLLQNQNQIILRLKVDPSFCNYMGSIHGGALTTILDCATTLAILKVDKNLRKSVSAELNFSFMNPATIKDHILIRAECTKVGKTLAFTQGDIFIEETLKMVGRGQHLKAMLDQPFDS